MLNKLLTPALAVAFILWLVAAYILQLGGFITPTGGRSPNDLDSWLAILILLSVICAALALNAPAANTRTYARAFLGIGGLAVGVAFLTYGGAVVENPRPVATPADPAKPMLINIQVATLAALGAFALIAAWVSRNNTPITLATRNTDTYGSVSRFLHWSIALLILLIVPLGVFATMIPEGTNYRASFYVAHESLGFSILALVLARLAWHLWGGRPPLDPALKTWERRLAHTAHFFLYVLMIGLPISGIIMSGFNGSRLLFFFWSVESPIEKNQDMRFIFGFGHKIILPYLLYLFLSLHIIGALKHQFWDRHDNALKRMAA